MTRYLLAGAWALAACTLADMGPAAAADLPQAAPPPPQAPVAYIPTVAPVYNWGGIYWGINGGYGFGDSKWTDPNNFSALGSTGSFSTSGYVVGGTLGVNYQMDAFVIGAEGDLGATGIKGSSNSAFCAVIAAGVTSCDTKNTWLGTARVRVGYAADRVLFYGTAGGAFGNIESGLPGSSQQDSTKGGWTAGAGVEAAFADNWTARLEYLYVDLQSSTCTTSCGFNGFPVVANDKVSFTTSLIRAGLDYKFR